MNKTRQLKEELRQAGAKPSEMSELTHIATQLKQLSSSPNIARKQRLGMSIFKPIVLACSGVIIGAIIVMFSQSVEPTSWLYPVQQLSDAVAMKTHPQYRATVMMRQAQQVKELVQVHAPSQVILATLQSYQTVATKYEAMPHANYSAFDYCKANLEQAETIAPTNIRQAINISLDSLDIT